jgi:hypothetical protein
VRISGPADLHFIALQRLMLAALPRPQGQAVEPVALPGPLPPLALPQTSVAMLLAIAASDPEAQRRRNVADAAKGLKGLECLHQNLRIGSPGKARLAEIAAWMDNHGIPDDPGAAALLREVELRVLVELAKADRDNVG